MNSDTERAARIANIKNKLGNAGHIDLRMLRKAKAERNFIDFVRYGWPSMDPSEFVDNWHLGAVAEHLQAVNYGQIRKLIINVPPRTSKSLLCSVAWPAWTWIQEADEGPLTGPQTKFLCASYAQDLSNQLSVQCRRLIQSPWYRENWGEEYSLLGDQNAKMHFDNSKGGYRMATAVDGGLTGKGGDIILIDDPHNVKQAESALVRQGTQDWFDQALSTRFNNPKTGALVIIMQRVHSDDITNRALEQGGYEHLMLPMRFEADRKFYTSIGFADPRTEEGELLCPGRFGDEEVDNLERALGPYGFAGQMQQRPEPKGGGIFKTDDWQDWCPDNGQFPPFDFVIASLDSAYGEKQENDYSALTIWGIWRDGTAHRIQGDVFDVPVERDDPPKVMLAYAWAARLPLHATPRQDGETVQAFKARRGLVDRVIDDCRRFKVDMLLIEGKASGMSVAQEIRRLCQAQEFAVKLVNPKGDKVQRAYAVQHLWSQKLIYAPLEKVWADQVVQQMATFPRGSHDDLVDSATQALNFMRSSGLFRTPDEHYRDKAKDKNQGRSKPLYPV